MRIVEKPSGWKDYIHNEELSMLHARGLTDSQIAGRMQKPRELIAAKRSNLGLTPNEPPKPKPAVRLNIPARLPAMQTAIVVFGTRLVQKGGACFLDGEHLQPYELIQRTNRVLKANGIPQVGGPEHHV